MPVTIGGGGQASFDQPLALLQDCHRRIEHFLGVLVRVADGASGGELDEAQRRALEAALRYFREAAPRHTADEEESLFPRLRACGGEAVQAALVRVEALHADHQRADVLHRSVDEAGRRWLEEGRISQEARRKLRDDLGALEELYRGHLRVEDGDIFPLAGISLSAEELGAIGREMQARRVVKAGP